MSEKYSFSLTTFSPSGKLVQIEYALQAVQTGAMSIGIKSSTGAVLVTEKRLSNGLIDEASIEKVFQITQGIGCVYSGMGPDARVLIRKSRKVAAGYFRKYQCEIPLGVLVSEMARVMQEFTQSGGVRPFGISLLVAGCENNETKVYQVDPSGSFFAWKATAIGKQYIAAKNFLEKRYNDEMEVSDAIQTGILALQEQLDGRLTEHGVEIGVCTLDQGFRKLSLDEIRDYINAA